MKNPIPKNSIFYSALLHLLVLNFLFLNFKFFDKTNYVTHSSVMNATLIEIPKPTAPVINKKKEVSLPDEIVKAKSQPEPQKPKPELTKPKPEPVPLKIQKMEKPKTEVKKLEPEKTIKIEDKKTKPEKPKPTVKNEAKDEQKPLKKEEKKVEEKKIEKKPVLTKAQTKAIKTQKNMEEKLWAEQFADEDKQISSLKEQQAQGVINKYNALILAAIRAQWILPEAYPPSLSCQLLINLKPDGTVVDVQLTKSSGNEGFDHSARAAVYKASPLPVPKETDLFNQMKEINLVVRP